MTNTSLGHAHRCTTRAVFHDRRWLCQLRSPGQTRRSRTSSPMRSDLRAATASEAAIRPRQSLSLQSQRTPGRSIGRQFVSVACQTRSQGRRRLQRLVETCYETHRFRVTTSRCPNCGGGETLLEPRVPGVAVDLVCDERLWRFGIAQALAVRRGLRFTVGDPNQSHPSSERTAEVRPQSGHPATVHRYRRQGGAMVDRIPGPRRKLRRFAKTAIAVKRLLDARILDLGNLGMTLETAKNAEVYDPQAALTIQGGRKYPSLPAVSDERGTLTYRQVNEMSSALARGLSPFGVTQLGRRAALPGPPRPDHRDGRMRQDRRPDTADEYRISQAAIRAGLRSGRGQSSSSRQ